MADRPFELKHVIAACTAIAGEGVRRGENRLSEFPHDSVLVRDIAKVLFNRALIDDEFANKIMKERGSLDMH